MSESEDDYEAMEQRRPAKRLNWRYRYKSLSTNNLKDLSGNVKESPLRISTIDQTLRPLES